MAEIDEISQQLGRLSAGIDGLKDLMVSHHSEADKHWDAIYAELRTIKHDQRNLEQKDVARSQALSRIGSKLRPLEDLPDKIDAIDRRLDIAEAAARSYDKLDTRLGLIEKLVWRASGIAAVIVAIGSIIGYLITRYGGEFIRWAMGKS